MQYTRRKMLAYAGAAMAMLNTTLKAQAEGVTTAEGKLVYGFPAGSIASLMGDILLDHLRQDKVANLRMVYMPGNGSRYAHEAIRGALPDGSNLQLVSSTSLTLYPHIYGKRLNYAARDYTPIAPLYAFTRMLVVGTAVPASIHTVDDYMKWVQTNPLQSNVGVSAIGSGSHFATMLLAQSRDTVLRPVTYRGTDSAMKDLVSGNLPAAFIVADQNMRYLEGGQVRVLALTSAARWPTWPDVPTLKEQGVPACEIAEWHGVFGPAGMDPAKVDALNIGIRHALHETDMVESARKMGLNLLDMSSAQFGNLVAQDQEQWRRAVQLTRFHGME